MVLQSGYDCWLTQSADVPASDRVFVNNVRVSGVDDFMSWKEVTGTQKEEMLMQTAIIDVDNMSMEALSRIDVLLSDIQEHINDIPMTASEALEKRRFFPEWENLTGVLLPVGYRLQYNDVLFEVISEHTVQTDWVPDFSTLSLYKVVQVEHEGTMADPIVWEKGMELVEGKYYMDDDVLYLCIRNSEVAMSYNLADLVSGGYVTADMDEEHVSSDGTAEHPVEYTAGMTLVKGKYYSQFGVVYLCIQDAESLVYDLKDIPAIAEVFRDNVVINN